MKNPGFRITDGKGFSICFENGWRLSVQFGGGNYCGNYDDSINEEGWSSSGENGCSTAETAAINDETDEWYFKDQVKGYQTPEEVLNDLILISSLPKAILDTTKA